MKNMLGLISLYEDESGMGPLTGHRPLSAMPYAGRYRLIDFTLSNLVNAEIRTVGVLVRDKYRSLIDHLRSGKEWDLARKRDGLYILPPAYGPGEPTRGDINNFMFNLDYLLASSEDFVVVCGSRAVCNLSLEQAFQYHLSIGADVTVIGRDWPDSGRGPCLSVDDDGRITGICEPGEVLPYDLQPLGFFILSKSLLGELVRKCYAAGSRDLFADGILQNLAELKVFGFRHTGYSAIIDSIASYYHHQLELLKPSVWQDLFFRYGIVYTKVRDEAPAKYKEQATVRNSLVATGCVIEGTVENSILSRSVVVERGATVRNSIIGQNCRIGPRAQLDMVLCDKDTTVSAGRVLTGAAPNPFIVRKGAVV